MLKVTVYVILPMLAAALALRLLDGSLPRIIPCAFALVVVPLVALHLLLGSVNS